MTEGPTPPPETLYSMLHGLIAGGMPDGDLEAADMLTAAVLSDPRFAVVPIYMESAGDGVYGSVRVVPNEYRNIPLLDESGVLRSGLMRHPYWVQMITPFRVQTNPQIAMVLVRSLLSAIYAGNRMYGTDPAPTH